MAANTYVWPAIPSSGPASARPVGSGSTQRAELGMGEPIYPLSVTYGSKACLLRYLPMYSFTPHPWGPLRAYASGTLGGCAAHTCSAPFGGASRIRVRHP